jgi:plastocyanin
MTRLVTIAVAYAAIAALLVAAPLSAQQETPPAPTATDVAPVPEQAPADAAPAPAEPAPAPAPAPQAAQPAPAAPAPAAEPPASASPAPAEPAPAELEPVQADAEGDERPADRPKRKRVPKAKAAASRTVTISDFQFAPASTTVNVGDTVTWNNDGPTAHSATATGGSFDTGIFGEGQSRSHTFDEAGTFSYICTPHPNMKGTITVQAAQTGEGGETPSGGETDTGDDSGSTAGATGSSGSGGSSSGSSLPATGLDAGGLLVLGLVTLALGAYLRRRAAVEAPRPSGRVGW